MQEYRQFDRLTRSHRWWLLAWTIGILAGIGYLLFCGFFLNQALTFYQIARAHVQGTVISSDSWQYSTGTSWQTSCTTTIQFTPLDQSSSFTTTDHQCDPLNNGTLVAVFYDPNHPATAKTQREAFGNLILAIGLCLLGPFFLLLGALDMRQSRRRRRPTSPRRFQGQLPARR